MRHGKRRVALASLIPVSCCRNERNVPRQSRLQWTYRESNPDLQSAELPSSPLDPRPSVRGVGIEPTVSSSQGWRITAFLPPEWTARESHPHFRCAKPASSCWTSSPFSEVRSQRSERHGNSPISSDL